MATDIVSPTHLDIDSFTHCSLNGFARLTSFAGFSFPGAGQCWSHSGPSRSFGSIPVTQVLLGHIRVHPGHSGLSWFMHSGLSRSFRSIMDHAFGSIPVVQVYPGSCIRVYPGRSGLSWFMHSGLSRSFKSILVHAFGSIPVLQVYPGSCIRVYPGRSGLSWLICIRVHPGILRDRPGLNFQQYPNASKQAASSHGEAITERSPGPERGCLLWSLATPFNRACNQREASCQHPILAHRLPTRESPIKARVTVHDPAIRGK
ncbi:hypothetical protein CRG98_042498 [Punica granatum]|uniref:Uncharacterized protein n=1 Tax=Punica granatum TaxID=22663 RepID=A0A2I0HZH7_PUNGR|nr:hypothetical protein CRG98_042498 [Punica granatum]